MRILLAEDHPMFRDGLAALLGGHADIDGVTTAATGAEALALAEEAAPDVAVLDLRLPDGDGVWLAGALLERLPGLRILILTSAEDDRSVSEALAAGAHGYLLKTAGPDEIVEAIRAVAAGAGVVSDQVLATLAQRGRSRPLPELTDREFDVLESLAHGHTTEATAQRLAMSTKTVRNHVSSLLTKLAVEDRTAAVVVAHRHGVGAGG